MRRSACILRLRIQAATLRLTGDRRVARFARGRAYRCRRTIGIAVVTRFSVEHSHLNRKHSAVLVAGPRRISLAKFATLRVALRVSNFLKQPLKHETPRSRGA